MSQSTKPSSKSSGICLHCNFFHRLAAHMVSSERCMIASQESLSNKRVCCEYDTHVDSGRKKAISPKITNDCNKPHTSVHNIPSTFLMRSAVEGSISNTCIVAKPLL